MRPAGLIVACALSAIVVTEAAAFRLATAAPDNTPLPDRVLVVLIAAAALIVALLALPRARTLGWAAATVAAGLGAIEVVAAVRALEPYASGSTWRDLSGFAAVALVVAASVAAAFAARDWQGATGPSRGWMLLISVGTVASVAASIWAVAEAEVTAEAGQLSPLRVAVRIALVAIAGGLLLGISRDVAPPIRRAFARSGASGAPNDGRLWRFLRSCGHGPRTG